MNSIEESCFWMTAPRNPAAPQLLEDHHADVAVVGGGFTGFWTALFLKEIDPSAEVVLVEKNVAGYGGSGRNAGILGETIDHSHGLAITHFGLDEARRLAKLGRDNVREMYDFCKSNGVDCDFELSGRLYVALTQAHLEEARNALETARLLNVPDVRILNREEVRSEIDSPLYFGGMEAGGGGILHPVKLIDGLKRVAMERGVKVHEQSPVLEIHQDVVKTEHGQVQARKIVLATDAYSHHLFPQLLWRFVPLYDYVLVSEPLSDAQSARIGWRKRQGVTDGRTFFNYYRLTADHRIVWGTSEAVYYPPNRVGHAHDHSERHYADLRESFIRHFPQLKELQFPYAWGGAIASTTRLTPFFGTLEGGRVVYGFGYTGRGVGSTRIAGKILAHLALEKSHELLQLKMVRNKPLPYPPEPIRSHAIRAVARALRRVDEGKPASLLLRMLDLAGISFSS